jgi:guanylate kinase
MQGKVIILTAPSGSGKTTLANMLMAEFPIIRFSVSATTRKPRENEVHGVNYYFLSAEEFENKVDSGEFLEHETFYNGTRYGTLKSDVEKQLKKGYFILLDIEVNGAKNIKDQFGDECLSIFVKPPSIQVLESRLRNRGTESEESLKIRLERVQMELAQSDTFDALVINDELGSAYNQLKSIVEPFLNSTNTHGN